MDSREYAKLSAEPAPTLFTPDHLAKLKEHFSGLKRVDPCSETWLGLRATVEGYQTPLLAQVAGANIPWLSYLAKAELVKRNLTAV